MTAYVYFKERIRISKKDIRKLHKEMTNNDPIGIDEYVKLTDFIKYAAKKGVLDKKYKNIDMSTDQNGYIDLEISLDELLNMEADFK